jgi:hypothetical protein
VTRNRESVRYSGSAAGPESDFCAICSEDRRVLLMARRISRFLLKSASFRSCSQPENSHTAGILPIGDEFRERIIFRRIEEIIRKRAPQSVGYDKF